MLEWIGLIPLLGLTGNWRGYRMGGKAIGGANMSTDMKKKFEAARAAGDMEKAKALADKAQSLNDAKKEKLVAKPVEEQVEKPSSKEPTGTHKDGLQRRSPDFEQQLATYAKDKGIEVAEARNRTKAIFNYTHSDYEEIRKAQKEGQKEGQYAKFARDIENYIKDGTPFKGTIHRGVSFNTPEAKSAFLEGLAGGQLKSGAMTSWSSSKKIADNFTTKRKVPPSQQVIMSVQNKSGVSIRGLSNYVKEDEVLVGQNRPFKVLEIKQDASGRTVIRLEEE